MVIFQGDLSLTTGYALVMKSHYPWIKSNLIIGGATCWNGSLSNRSTAGPLPWGMLLGLQLLERGFAAGYGWKNMLQFLVWNMKYMGVSIPMGVLPNRWLIRENSIKMDDWGASPFQETSIWTGIYLASVFAGMCLSLLLLIWVCLFAFQGSRHGALAKAPHVLRCWWHWSKAWVGFHGVGYRSGMDTLIAESCHDDCICFPCIFFPDYLCIISFLYMTSLAIQEGIDMLSNRKSPPK